jgi:O-antigen/teichoic acid export membrane protein
VSTLKNASWMGASTAIRLLFGVLTFSILARLLGPTSFGILMVWFSISALCCLAANYGFNSYVLRDMGLSPGDGKVLIEGVITAKVLISLVILLLSLATLYWLPESGRLIFVPLICMHLIDSFTDILNVGYRATNRFGEEAKVATGASFIQFLIVGGVAYVQPTPFATSLALATSRLAVLAMTWVDQAAFFSGIRMSTIGQAKYHLVAAKSYAADFGLQSLFGHIDSIVLAHFATPTAVGLHQAGLRVFQGGAQITNILGNVFIPKLAGAMNNPVAMHKESTRIQTAFVGSGLIFGGTMALFPDLIVHILFGPTYGALTKIFPWFGLLFFIRLCASGYGVILTSAGRQSIRAKANVIHWGLILLPSGILIHIFGNIGWLMCMCIGNTYLVTTYYFKSRDLLSINLTVKVIYIAATLVFVYPILEIQSCQACLIFKSFGG